MGATMHDYLYIHRGRLCVTDDAAFKDFSLYYLYCVKGVRNQSYTGPHFPVFSPNVEKS